MNRTMITATNTMSQLQHKMDIIGHNLANVQTNGYKRKETYFNELLFQEFNNQIQSNREIGRLTPNGIRQGVGAKLSQAKLVLAQGSLKPTGRDLDVALTKEDLFFKVRVTENNREAIHLTRDGAFYLNPVAPGSNDLMLVTSSGYPILDEFNQPIIVTGSVKNITFTEHGELIVEKDNLQKQTFSLGIVSVKKPQYLEQKMNNTLGLSNEADELGIEEDAIYTDLNGGLRQNIALQQRTLEASNVDMSKEMTDLINLQRHYQFQARSVTLADQMMGLINGIR
ncbi:flagellar hook-basal body protein [Peribacillus tepidiphilus]|uniref:flagellar hook-basal body protein n=1 Tax=Peribacillus tepidiphilus TaxID=2652445 RepID=UPI0035B547AD